MSQWTHVNGSIRIDSLRMLGADIDFKEMFKTADYESDYTEWDSCNVPMGSEGSIDINIWENLSECAMAAYTVNFFGDLRDYDSEKEIVDWFTKIVENKEIMIRDAVMCIDIEGRENTYYASNEDGDGVVKIK